MQARQSWFRVSLILSFSHRKKVLGKREDLRGAESSLSIYKKKRGSEEAAWGDHENEHRHPTMGYFCHHRVVIKLKAHLDIQGLYMRSRE